MQFLTTKQISGEIERIIRDAENFIIIISPFVKVSSLYLDRLRESEMRDVKSHFVFGKENMGEIEVNKFARLSKMKMYFLENLHAKCYLNEERAVITSMNLYEYSENTNREMGIVVEKASEEKIYNDISKEANSIIQNAAPLLTITGKKKVLQSSHQEIGQSGSCIRCGTQILLNPEKPLCFACYDTWAEFFNYDYPERFCHSCGEPSETAMSRPLCMRCYKERLRG